MAQNSEIFSAIEDTQMGIILVKDVNG